MRKFVAPLIVCFFALPCLNAQDNFFSNWQHRASDIQSKQPSWSVPLNQPYPMLIQVFRFDFTRQITPTHTDTLNYGLSKGLNLIPGFNSEVDVYPPPYFEHHSAVRDGFGDPTFGYKYRILSANEKQGDYMLSAQLFATIPTGSYSNGNPAAVLTPTLEGGKGFGNFDIISTLGGTLPTSDTVKIGRTIPWNTTAQIKLGKYLWPELESNATYYFGGKNGGKMQNFLEPGLTAGKFKIHPKDKSSRAGFAFGGGMQIATSGFHTYNHALVFTSRFLF